MFRDFVYLMPRSMKEWYLSIISAICFYIILFTTLSFGV